MDHTTKKELQSATFERLIQHLRDEALRFGIALHRKKRKKGWLTTSLDSIPGIGEKTIRAIKFFIKLSLMGEISFALSRHRKQAYVHENAAPTPANIPKTM